MNDFARISQALGVLESVLDALTKIAARTDDRRRHDLIQLRRDLALQIVAVGKVADPIFAKSEDLDVARTYRDKFSRMRSTTAIHQANWPAVQLDQAGEAYKKSALTAQQAHQDFVAWMRSAIKTAAPARG